MRRQLTDGQTYRYIGAPPSKPTPDGFSSVGDLGWVDEEGYLFIADRRVDLIITGGANVYPAEVEAALHEHPAVADVAVIGVPDEEWGKRVHAVIQPRAGRRTRRRAADLDATAASGWPRTRRRRPTSSSRTAAQRGGEDPPLRAGGRARERLDGRDGRGEGGGVTAMMPLAGLRVLTLAFNVPGPVAAARLTALGAAVTKVEPPGGDPLARASAAWYAELAAGQQIVRLDLKASGDRAALDDLLAESDLLLTATRPAALARLDLAWPALHARHPRLSQVAMIGHAPPDAERPGHDLTYLASAGLLTPPAIPRTLFADLAAAERAVSAALALLLGRLRGHEAAYAAVALAAVAEELAAPLRHGLTAPSGPLGGSAPQYNCYRTSDGWLAVAALEPHFRARLAQELGIEPLDRNALQAIFATRTAADGKRGRLRATSPSPPCDRMRGDDDRCLDAIFPVAAVVNPSS